MSQQGFYPDPPSRRMAFDQDGTIVLFVASNLSSITELTEGQRISLNDEGSSSVMSPYDNTKLTFIFPEKRNVTHYYAALGKEYHYADTNGATVEWSNDTTNGQDGTWEVAASSWVANSNNGDGASGSSKTPGFPDMRLHMITLPINGVKAVRFNVTSSWTFVNEEYFYSFHLYGHKAAGETPHRIDFAYADGSELIQDFDYGDQPRGTTRTWSAVDTYNVGTPLYFRNRSPDKLAQNVVISIQGHTGEMVNDVTISKDNISYGTQVTFTEIQPLQQVGPIYVKHETQDTEGLGLRTCRLRIGVGDWI